MDLDLYNSIDAAANEAQTAANNLFYVLDDVIGRFISLVSHRVVVMA